MKKLILVLMLLVASVNSQANWFNSNNGEWKMGPNGAYWDDSNWPEWTPMYWMEEFMGEFDNNGWGGSNNGNYSMPYGAYSGYGMTPYNYQPNPYYGYISPYGVYPAPTNNPISP